MDAAALSELPLFSDLSESDLEIVARHADRTTVPAGTVFMREGDRGLGVMVIVSGTARVSREGQDLDEVGPGSVLGEIGVMEDQPRRATVQAITDLDVVVMFDPDFREVVEEVPEVRAKVLAIIEQRLGGTSPGDAD